MKKYIIFLLFVLSGYFATAQQTPVAQQQTPYDTVRANGNRVIYNLLGINSIRIVDSIGSSYIDLDESYIEYRYQKATYYADTTENTRSVSILIRVPFSEIRTEANALINSSRVNKAVKRALRPNIKAKIVEE